MTEDTRLLTEAEINAIPWANPRLIAQAQDVKSLRAVGARLLAELRSWAHTAPLPSSVHTTLRELVESLRKGEMPEEQKR